MFFFWIRASYIQFTEICTAAKYLKSCNYHLSLRMNGHIVKSHSIYRIQIGFSFRFINSEITVLESIIQCGFRRKKNDHTRQSKAFASQSMSFMVLKYHFLRFIGLKFNTKYIHHILLFTVTTTLNSRYKFD